MRTTVTLDDDLIADAATYSGVDDKSKLINLALDHYIKRMAAKRLVALGGTMPDLVIPARNTRTRDDDSPAKEAARALVALGGTMPDLEMPSRRRLEEPPLSLKVAEGGEPAPSADAPRKKVTYPAKRRKKSSGDTP